MVDAFTFDDGAPHKFRTRKEMYDWMVDNGHAILDGDDAAKFEQHVSKSKSAKAAEMAAKIAERV